MPSVDKSEDINVYIFKDIISDLPKEQKEKIKKAYNEIMEIVNRDPDVGAVATCLVAIENYNKTDILS